MEPRTSSRLRRALWIAVPVLAIGAIALPRALAWGRPHHPHANSPAELAEQLDQAALARTRDELDALANRATDVGLSSVFELAEVLTPAQRQVLAERLARFER